MPISSGALQGSRCDNLSRSHGRGRFWDKMQAAKAEIDRNETGTTQDLRGSLVSGAQRISRFPPRKKCASQGEGMILGVNNVLGLTVVSASQTRHSTGRPEAKRPACLTPRFSFFPSDSSLRNRGVEPPVASAAASIPAPAPAAPAARVPWWGSRSRLPASDRWDASKRHTIASFPACPLTTMSS